MLDPSLSRLAVVAVCILISSLAYLPQLFLFQDLSQTTALLFNGSVLCIWISYFRAIVTDPGSVPPTWEPSDASKKNMDAEEGRGRGEQRRLVAAHGRWCRKCNRWKPPRAHHCKTCQKCVLRMDHHCPWTNNCVGYANLPDFLRFLGFATFTTWWDWGMLAREAWGIWSEREMPAYLGHYSTSQIVLLFILLATAFFTAFFLSILLARTWYQVAQNYTTIETWEESKHEDTIRRARRSHMHSNRGAVIPKKQVFPYDIGIWENLCCAFGYSWNILAWGFVLTPTLKVGEVVETTVGGEKIRAGLEWEINGFEDPGTLWPPADPDKEAWRAAEVRKDMETKAGFSTATTTTQDTAENGQLDVNAFRQRQQQDLERRKKWQRPPGFRLASPPLSSYPPEGRETKEVWRNEDGETLADYGVDEDEEEEEEEVPLAVLMRRRKRQGDQVADLASMFL